MQLVRGPHLETHCPPGLILGQSKAPIHLYMTFSSKEKCVCPSFPFIKTAVVLEYVPLLQYDLSLANYIINNYFQRAHSLLRGHNSIHGSELTHHTSAGTLARACSVGALLPHTSSLPLHHLPGSC